MLEVDNRVILPEITHTRFILTAADVIHSFAIPALGVKCDAYPGRLNQFSVLINRLGTFYGQCSNLWYFTQFYANCCRICIIRKILVMITRTITNKQQLTK